MSNTGPGAERGSPSPRRESTSPARLVIFVVTVTVGCVALAAGIPWLVVITPRWMVRGAVISFLWTLLGVYALAAPAVLLGGGWSCLTAARARRRRERAALLRALRWVLLASTCLLSLIAMEMISAMAVRRSYQIPALPTRFAAATDQGLQRPGPARPGAIDQEPSGGTRSQPMADDGLYLVVVGESSARGEPYEPWVSVGQIVGWQLERIFPGRKVTVDVRARGGFTLQQSMLRLADLARRPDAVIVFSGHNEFQTNFGWSRNVRHYVEEGPESPLALLELARSISSTATLILKTLDRYYGEAPPPPGVTRELVDHPICTPNEYAAAREDFQRRLDALVAYCNGIGALPILIVPGSNDGSFEPNRSVLAGSTPAAARGAFAQAFKAARAAEESDPGAAMAAYRGLVAQHPEFAESHFRLARLLAAAGAFDLANQHFIWARDRDASPARCPTDFRETFRTVTHRRGALLVDAPALLANRSPHGILDDQLYHDAHHLNLIGTVALAQDILGQLQARRAFGWPVATLAPRIELAECVRHFELDAQKWAKVCHRSAEWFAIASNLRYDTSQRLDLADRYAQASRAIAARDPLPATIPPNLVPLLPILETLGGSPSR
jgi:hypothetical protein